MRKLLKLLGSLTIVSTSAATVVACGDPTLPIITEDISGVINELKVETNEIFKKHLENNIYKNLVGLTDTEISNAFLNQTKIQQYQGQKVNEIDKGDIEKLEADINKVLEISELTKSLNELKTVNWFEALLNSNEIETFDISDTFKYTSTNSEALKTGSDKFYANIVKDYFSTTAESDRKHTNLRWDGIKGKKELSDGYGIFESELKKYYQEDAKTNQFESSLTEFIKNNYFKEISNTLNNDINNSVMLFDLGYINFYIDLDQITLGSKTLGEKSFIKFI